MNSDKRNSGNMNNIGERYKDRITEHRDAMDSIFIRLQALESSKSDIHEEIDYFKDELKKRIIDFDFRLNEMELQLEELKQRKKPRKKKS
tara:strand:- start:88 stop:357 length:270 start_codon:yes stop_codon:yes gene_type:complete